MYEKWLVEELIFTFLMVRYLILFISHAGVHRESSKMATQEASELQSSCSHRECTATPGAIPSEGEPETSWATAACLTTEKILTEKHIGKAEAHSCHTPTASGAPCNCEGTLNSRLLSEIWTSHSELQFLKFLPERQTLQTPHSESQ